MLYNYSLGTYQFKQAITTIGTMIGILLFIIVFLGMCSPIGKFIIFQALTVVQMTYFGLIQFEHLPITLEGLKYLAFSNGINFNMFSTGTIIDRNTFSFMGIISTSLFTNYNITFFILCLAPFLIGLATLLILKLHSHEKTSPSTTSDISSSLS